MFLWTTFVFVINKVLLFIYFAIQTGTETSCRNIFKYNYLSLSRLQYEEKNLSKANLIIHVCRVFQKINLGILGHTL